MKLHFAVAGALAGALISPAATAANDDVSNAQLYASLIINNFECDALVPAAEQIEASFVNWDSVERAEIVDAFSLLADPDQGACGSLANYAHFMSGLAATNPAVFDAELHLSKHAGSKPNKSGKHHGRLKSGHQGFSLFGHSSEAPAARSEKKTSDYRN